MMEIRKVYTEITVAGKVYRVDINEPMTLAELCFYAKTSRKTIAAMKRDGFKMERDEKKRLPCASMRKFWNHWKDKS